MRRYFLILFVATTTLLQSYDYSSEHFAIKRGKTVPRGKVQDLRYNRYACSKCPYISHKKKYKPRKKLCHCPAKKYVAIPRDYPRRVFWHENGQVEKIERIDTENNVLYTHEYRYNDDGMLIAEVLPFGLGIIEYEECKTTSPFHEEEWEIDENNNVISHTIDGDRWDFTYTESGELDISPEDIEFHYNKRGDLVTLGDTRFFYNKKHQLKKAITPSYVVKFKYNKKGERISRTINGKKERYGRINGNDHGILREENIIHGITSDPYLVRAIAIETKDGVFIPIYDRSNNIIKLINGITHEITTLNRCDPFGKGLSKDAPVSFIFASKHYDKDLDLVYFGARFYSPKIHKWLTPDPAKQSSDPYHYCFNNPLRYHDLNGRFSFAIPLVSLTWGGSGASAGAVLATIFSAEVAIPAVIAAGCYFTYVYVDGKFEEYQANGMAESCNFLEYFWHNTVLGKNEYEIKEYYHELFANQEMEKRKKERLDHEESPPYTWDDLGNNPNKCPGKGFEWKGKGTPKSGKGNWVKGKKKNREELLPDFNNPQHDPHWDYYSPKFPGGARIYPDGWEHKVNK